MNAFKRQFLQDSTPAIILVLGLILVTSLGVITNQKDKQHILLETQITAEQVKIRLESCISARVKQVEILANHAWEDQRQILDEWTEPASTLLPLYSGVLALNYIDPDRVIRVVYPTATNRSALNVSLRENRNASVLQALDTAQETSLLTRTSVIELLQSGKGFALYKRIAAPDGTLLGFANGVFRIQELMDSCLSEKSLRDQFVIGIYENDNLIYSPPDSNQSLARAYSVTSPIDMVGRPWQLEFTPSHDYVDEQNNILDKIWIGLGLLFTLMLAMASRHLAKQQSSLTANEDKYRLLVENQTDMVVKVNPKGEFQYVSPNYCATFGESEQQLLGTRFLPLVHDDDRELTERSFASLQHPPHTSYHEQRAMTKDGWRWLAWSNKAVLNNRGDIEAITAVGRDVTEIKRLEENIAHSQKMKAIGEMAGGITHDFNNMLQVIIGNIECLLLSDSHTADTRESLEQVCKVVERAMSLTQKLSTLSRQEITHREVFDINSFCHELIALLEHTLPASISLSSTLADQPIPVHADRALIEQVILNICFNARDAIKSNGSIRIRTSRKTLDTNFLRQLPDVKPGEYCVITIKDDGCGINSDVIPRIFDPFYTTKESGTGTGLGLSNCYSIIKQHRGMILVDSSPESGTCFSVYLPVSDQRVQAGPTRRTEPFDSVAPANRLILVADDNAEILELTRLALKSIGLETIGACDGREALELYHRYQNDISMLVLDLVMPKMSGQEVADTIRRTDHDVKILFVTGYIPESVTATLKEPIIRKPYKRAEFLKAVGDLLSG